MHGDETLQIFYNPTIAQNFVKSFAVASLARRPTEFLLSPQSQQMLAELNNKIRRSIRSFKVHKKSSSSIKSSECIINYEVCWEEGAMVVSAL